MTDRYGRNIDYLRLSVTERCNLNCRYCMPGMTDRGVPSKEISAGQILEIVKASAKVGISKIRITGGEPLVRSDCTDIIRAIKRTEGIQSVGLTTNGLLLEEKLDELLDAKIDEINVSLDTADAEKYKYITGRDCFNKVLSGIFSAQEIGIRTKINAVVFDYDLTLTKALEQQKLTEDIRDLILIAKDRPIDIRFIETMPIGCAKDIETVSNIDLMRAIENEFGAALRDESIHGFGPAKYYKLNGFAGSIGLISSVNRKFCSECNRVRLTSKGFLKACLCYDVGEDLMKYFNDPDCSCGLNADELAKAIERVIYNKPESHCFEKPEGITETGNMFSIGG